ncbi:hypothetical protein DSO57_1004693 [Entomophthora muscae]|uniref:Uncharacterized protein n=1 Tax=Entomophthora muscae TaxID=34485 RepID=A0ACC2U5Y6_9FUNG|nr:hypothetical protein DSO57_1004693 [Entomophthora muscae]
MGRKLLHFYRVRYQGLLLLKSSRNHNSQRKFAVITGQATNQIRANGKPISGFTQEIIEKVKKLGWVSSYQGGRRRNPAPNIRGSRPDQQQREPGPTRKSAGPWQVGGGTAGRTRPHPGSNLGLLGDTRKL